MNAGSRIKAGGEAAALSIVDAMQLCRMSPPTLCPALFPNCLLEVEQTAVVAYESYHSVLIPAHQNYQLGHWTLGYKKVRQFEIKKQIKKVELS